MVEWMAVKSDGASAVMMAGSMASGLAASTVVMWVAKKVGYWDFSRVASKVDVMAVCLVDWSEIE